jgi:hypothetical protein
VSLVARGLRRPRLRNVLVALAAAGFLTSVLVQNQRALRGALALPDPWRFRALVPAAGAVAALGLVAVACDR